MWRTLGGVLLLAVVANGFTLLYVSPNYDLLVQATVAVSEAVHRLRKSRKLSELSDKLIEIHHKESIGDDNHHAALSRLFSGGVEPLDVIKWKDVYGLLEGCIDKCEDVANIIEKIAIKHA